MSGSIPYLGSKISLISKSEIRYEGILYTIDAQESIIALAKVRSFGTEDRPTDMPVPARDEVYEYIIFRGTDIKKIEVCETPKQTTLSGGLHNDPAIVQHSAPTVASSFQAAPFSRQPLGPIGGGIGMGLSYNYGQSITHQGLPGGAGFPVGASSQASEFSGAGGSGSGASGSGVEGSSVEASAVGTSIGKQPVPAPIGAPAHASGSPRTHSQSDILEGSRSSTPAARKSPVSDAGVQVSPPPSGQDDKKKGPIMQKTQQESYTSSRQQRETHQKPMQPRRNQQWGGPGQRQPYQNQQGFDPGYPGHYQVQYQSQYRGMGRGKGNRRPSQSRGGRGVFTMGSRQRQLQDQQLFEKEFDFEQANEQFEELRTQLAKTKISENGDKKTDDSGHETATGDEAEEGSVTYYDKSKSFFDNISCEAVERSKGRNPRPDWRQERKINAETFGISSTRRNMYPRGRGGYYGRGGFYRNYSQGYRVGGNFRGGFRGGPSAGSFSLGTGGGGGFGNRGGAVNGLPQRHNAGSYSAAMRNSSSK